MARRQADLFLRQVRSVVAAETGQARDRELIERFVSVHDGAAIDALIQRHGPMVLRVCQAVLRDVHAAEDAFQATFLVLVRKAGAIRKQQSVASWLYKVAYRVALRASAVAAKRREREMQAPVRPTEDPLNDITWRELQAVFAEEVQRLAEKHRAPVVLCCLEGRTRDEAAQQLGWSVSVLKGRLERGRELLRGRLVQRGVALSTALGATLLSEGALRAAVPSALAENAVRAALVFSVGPGTAAGAVSAEVRALVHGVTRAMTLTKLKIAAACLVVTGLLLAGAGAAAHQILTNAQPVVRDNDNPRAENAAPARPRVDRNGDPLPAGAVARLGTNRFRHMHTISSLAYSGDGTRLLSGSWDGTVRYWDAATGVEIHRFKAPENGFSSVALSPDGKLLAAGNMGKTLFFWDAATGKEIRKLENLENTVFGLRFAPDSNTLAGVSGGILHVWDAADGKELHRLELGAKDLRPFTISADLKTFVAGGAGATIHLWDVMAGKEIHSFPGGHTNISCLAMSPDGATIASGGDEKDRTVRLWSRDTGKELHRFGPYAGWVESLAFAPDGKRLAAGDQTGLIRVYDVETGKLLRGHRLHDGCWVRALAFSPDGKVLAAGGTDERAIRFFDSRGEVRLYAGHQNEIIAAVVLSDGKSLLSASKDGLVCTWNLTNGEELHRLQASPKGISAIAMAPDSNTWASVGGDKAVHLADLAKSSEIRQLFGHGGTPDAVAFSGDGLTVASGTWTDHTIRLWDLVSGKEKVRIDLPKPNGHNYGDVPMVFSPDGSVLYSGSGDRANNSIYFWDSATGKELKRIPFNASRLALSPDGKLLATSGWDNRIRLWDTASAKEKMQIVGGAGALAFSRDGRMLAYGGTDGVVHVWEVTAGRERRRFVGHQPGGDERGTFAAGVAALVFTPDSRTVVSGGGDTTLLVWDLLATGSRPGPNDMERLWSDLAGTDAVKAYDAIATLVSAPAESVAFLRGKLQPAVGVDPQRLARLIADLDSNQFDVRERATKELERLDESATPALRKALTDQTPAETRRRLEQILETLDATPSGERLQALRAIETLEHIATVDARQVLEKIAGGVPAARQTQEAKKALERLARRD